MLKEHVSSNQHRLLVIDVEAATASACATTNNWWIRGNSRDITGCEDLVFFV